MDVVVALSSASGSEVWDNVQSMDCVKLLELLSSICVPCCRRCYG